ncbi:hypothetical protein [Mesorhizobium sp. IMUNJ 23232]|uniref:hypothetical protein n=1 Tax=Mesorhizobium sp. IMUNJ 23232 TaxID=3376064 RepID=UPI0037A2FA3D
MRPATLSETYERIIAGESREKAFAEFLDTFYTLRNPERQSTALAVEPPLTGDARLDALAGAVASYLAKKYRARVPAWAGAPSRYLKEPWFTTEKPGPGINEFLWHSSPAEFRSRNIFTEARPLRRASQAQGQRRPDDMI